MKKYFFVVILIASLFFGLSLVEKKATASLLDFFYKERDVLTVVGNKVFFNDKEIDLRGLAVGDTHSRVTIYGRDETDYEIIKKEWKANVVRLSVNPNYQRDEKKTKSILKTEIAAARKQGLLVIVDWHVIGFPNGWYEPWEWGEKHSYSYNSNFRTAMDFWKYMAVEYRGDRGVVFEIWNEPADKKERSWSDIKAYMQRLHDLIRAQGAKNIIIAPGVRWSYDLRGIKDDALSGDNIAYAWHNYPFSGQYLSWGEALDNLDKSYPVLVTEWGFSVDENKRHYAKSEEYSLPFKQYLLDRGLGFTAWCWHNPWDPRMFQSNWQTLTPYGQFVKDFLLEIDTGEQFNPEINNFIANGFDYNSRVLGEGERRAVIYSFQLAFGRSPDSSDDLADIKKIVNGRWPSQKSQVTENQAKESFKNIYKRESNMNNKNDEAAVVVMAYGLRQRAENRNLDSEAQGLKIFKAIFKYLPSTTKDWNILQAITYSGATR